MEGFLLIDGHNLVYKAAHVYKTATRDGQPTGIIFGFLDQFVAARTVFPDFLPLVVWDGGAKDRREIAAAAVAAGYVPDGYKANRHREEIDPVKMSIDQQLPMLRRLLSFTDVPQIWRDGYEADDVIASYCSFLKDKGQTIICLTPDHDYYQLLDDKILLVSRYGGEQKIIDLNDFKETYGISPGQWVDVGALCGDDGDNIHGVPGCGLERALELIKAHGGHEEAIRACCAMFAPLRLEHPDLATEEDVAALKATKPAARNPYSGCYPGMPFSGVALAFEQKRIKRVSLLALHVAMYQERARVAYRLKKMICCLQLPLPQFFSRFDEATFFAACDRHELRQVKLASWAFRADGRPR